MDAPVSRILESFPYPVAYSYSLIFAPGERPSYRRWALCFSVYQVLRMLCLPLVVQYLRGPIDEQAGDGIASLNRAIGGIRSPFFSDWITLLHTLRRHLPKVGIVPLFPQLDAALARLKDRAECPVGLRGDTRLDPLFAILALRNETAYGGVPDEAEAAGLLTAYLPVLHQVLDAFDFLGDALLKVCMDEPHVLSTGRARVRNLRGAALAEPAEEDLSEALLVAFEESPAALMTAEGQAAPLYPLLHLVDEREPLYLYDGHYGVHVHTAQGTEDRSYINYLGTHHRATDSPACERLKQLLDARRISFR